nr:berberine bridge enzyme-like 18 [Quercus suber]
MAGKALAACSNSDAVVLGSVKVGFSLGSVSDAEVTHGRGYRDSRSTGVMVGSSTMAEIEAPSLTVVSPILGRYPWVVHNRFSPLSDLGDWVVDEFVEGEDHVEVQKSHHRSHTHEDFLQCLTLHSEKDKPISNIIYTPSNSSYSSALNSYVRNTRFSTPSTPKPRVIVTPLGVSQIQETLYCAQKHRIQVRVRSGGHDYEGLSFVSPEPFVILDMINLRNISIDVENNTAWVQSGATLGELYYWIANKSRTLGFPAGVCQTIGVGGHFSGGGYGTLLRKYGLAADNVLDAHLIDVKGRFLDRKSMGEDLFWAIRGGGGASFGVIVSWKIKLVPVPANVTVFRVRKDLEQNATKILHRWQYVAPNIDRDLFIRVILTGSGSVQYGNRVDWGAGNAKKAMVEVQV